MRTSPLHVNRRLSELFASPQRSALEARLAAYVPQRRWFRSKTRVAARASLQHALPLPIDGVDAALAIVRFEFTEGPAEDYVLPLACVGRHAAEHLAHRHPQLLIAPVDVEEGEIDSALWLVDALGEPRTLAGLWTLLARGQTVEGDGCALTFRVVAGALNDAAAPRPLDTEQSNTSIVFGDVILKVIRKLEDGRSPDLEMGEFLTRAGYESVPRLLAAVELSRGWREPATVGMAHAFVPNQGDAWHYALSTIARSSEGTRGASASAVEAGRALAEAVAFVAPLAERVAGMHVALGSTTDPRFRPEPMDRPEREALGQVVQRSLDDVWSVVRGAASALPEEAIARLRRLEARKSAYRRCIERFIDAPGGCVKMRVHGDLHLGQVLVTGSDFVLIDFEGEPQRPIAERKAKRSPLVDVAGMLRSLHYASIAAWRAGSASRLFAEASYQGARREFVKAYFDFPGIRSIVGDDSRSVLLRFYLLEKCVYELHYEMNSRPDWVMIPIFGLEELLIDEDAS